MFSWKHFHGEILMLWVYCLNFKLRKKNDTDIKKENQNIIPFIKWVKFKYPIENFLIPIVCTCIANRRIPSPAEEFGTGHIQIAADKPKLKTKTFFWADWKVFSFRSSHHG